MGIRQSEAANCVIIPLARLIVVGRRCACGGERKRCYDRCNVPMARLIVVAGVVVFIVINRSVRAVLLVLLGDGG